MPDTMRLDRWLWAARFFRTRSLAMKAVDGGKVHVNGARVKRSKTVRAGDELTITRGIYTYEIVIRDLAEKRGPATEAERLYAETEASRRRRELLAAQMKSAPTPTFTGKGRPSKKDRRLLDRMRGSNEL